MAIDYTGFAFKKTGRLPKDDRKAAMRRHERTRATVKRAIMVRQRGRCYCGGTTPGCNGVGLDRHEIIPEGRGGPVETWNCVLVSRLCHRLSQNAVGGVKLVYDWPGKADGAKPNADRDGFVRLRRVA